MRRPNHLAGFTSANGPVILEEISLDQPDVRREGLCHVTPPASHRSLRHYWTGSLDCASMSACSNARRPSTIFGISESGTAATAAFIQAISWGHVRSV